MPSPFLDIDSNVFSGPTLCLPAGAAPGNTALDVYPLACFYELEVAVAEQSPGLADSRRGGGKSVKQLIIFII